MSQLVIITCPKCGKHLALKREPAHPDSLVRCLACSESTPYSKFSLAQLAVEPAPVILTPSLRLLSPSERVFDLKIGRNIIGRNAATSKADIKIDTADLRHISREHAIVDVEEESGKYTCYFSLYKKESNDTYVLDKKVVYGDKVCLNHGDILRFPDNVTMIFDMTDKDGTSINY